MRTLLFLFLLFIGQTTQAFQITALKIALTYLGSAVGYLPIALPLIIPKAHDRQNAADDRDLAQSDYNQASTTLNQLDVDIAETQARIEGADCAEENLSQFSQNVIITCANTLAQNDLDIVYKQTTSVSYTTHESKLRECHQVPHTSCSYKPYSCHTYYTQSCSYIYYDRVHQTIHDRNGNFATGGTNIDSDCHYYTQTLSLSGQDYIIDSRATVWTDELRQTTEDWSSKLVFSLGLDRDSFQSTLPLNKASTPETLKQQMQDFIEANCNRSLGLISKRSALYYNQARATQNETLIAMQRQEDTQSNSTKNKLAVLSAMQAIFNKADDAWRKQLKIHLPLLFIGVPAVAISALFLVQKIRGNTRPF